MVGAILGLASALVAGAIGSCGGDAFSSDASKDGSTAGAGGTSLGGAAGAGGGITCQADETICGDQCVKLIDPTFGCGAADCKPCSLDNATAVCLAGACAIGNCANLREDCDKDPANGCEVSLNSLENCGSCAHP